MSNVRVNTRQTKTYGLLIVGVPAEDAGPFVIDARTGGDLVNNMVRRQHCQQTCEELTQQHLGQKIVRVERGQSCTMRITGKYSGKTRNGREQTYGAGAWPRVGKTGG